MPFQRPPASFAHPGITTVWRSQACSGETNSGDGLFLESGRADGSMLFLIVDVMGHGDDASQTVNLLESRPLPDLSCQDLSPADLLKVLHGMLESEWVTTGRFVTALALLIDGTQGTVKASNAALPEPFVGRPGDSWQSWRLPGVSPLGLPIPDGEFAQAARHLATGEQVLAFTDGVSEAGAAHGTQFQHGPLQTWLKGLPGGLVVDQVVSQLYQAAQAYVGAGWPEDDLTVLGVQRI
jgi:serine phosphatase RsbU (regulator of sigma subunit)